MPKRKRDSSIKRNAKASATKTKKKFHTKKQNKREVIFDPEARKAYLRGFSERKRQRRAFGLAMQKVKDRKEKILERSEQKKDEEERIKIAEQQKEDAMSLLMEEEQQKHHKKNNSNSKDDDDDSSDDDNDSSLNESDDENDDEEKTRVLNEITYDDKKTAKQWGGRVTVVTSEVVLDDDDGGDDDDDGDSDNDGNRQYRKSVDVEQKYAGNVKKFMAELKGHMPSKKNKDRHHAKRKGRNGAADMPGMGGGAVLKAAQKVLSKTQSSSQQKGGGKGKVKKSKGKKRSRR